MIWIDLSLWKKKSGRETYSHMVADSCEELHAFASKIGVGGHFFHSSSKVHHYDISSKHYKKAIEAGAQVTSSKDILIRGKAMMLAAQMKDTKK